MAEKISLLKYELDKKIEKLLNNDELKKKNQQRTERKSALAKMFGFILILIILSLGFIFLI